MRNRKLYDNSQFFAMLDKLYISQTEIADLLTIKRNHLYQLKYGSLDLKSPVKIAIINKLITEYEKKIIYLLNCKEKIQHAETTKLKKSLK